MSTTSLDEQLDAALSADIAFLTQALLNVLQHETTAEVQTVLRHLLDGNEPQDTIQQALPVLDLQQQQDLIRACSLFAQLLNIAEDAHHERQQQMHDHSLHSEGCTFI